MVRAAVMSTLLAGALAGAACTPAHAPAVRSSGMVMALGGVAGIVGSAFATTVTDRARDMMLGFEVLSAVGIASYAYAELTWPRVNYIHEEPAVKHRRWAAILTERAIGAARDGRCARVRRLERYVLQYDHVIHDTVFVKDPEIRKCLGLPPEEPPPLGEPPASAPPSESLPPSEAAPPPASAPPSAPAPPPEPR